MTDFENSIVKAINYDENLNEFLDDYYYQPELTEKLDNIGDKNFNQGLINEIILWKLNRYTKIDNEIIKNLNKLKSLNHGEHRMGNNVIKSLLEIKGLGLAFVSALLRFRNPEVYQMIDKHSYRALFGEDYPIRSRTAIERKISIYFEYIEKLITLCHVKNIEYAVSDRVIYQFDKEENGVL